MRSISIIHPSRGRPEMAHKTIYNWLQKSDGDLEYILIIDESDPLRHWYAPIAQDIDGLRLFTRDNKSAVEAINVAANFFINDILIVVSDDFDCPEHWDTLLREAIGDRTDFCAKTKDGHQDWLITLPIVDREFYNRFGYIYNPEYLHMHADLEMTCVAWMLDKYISIDLEFHHNHPRYTNQIYDATYQRSRATWGHGKQTFTKRLAKNFALTGDLKPLPKLPPH